MSSERELPEFFPAALEEKVIFPQLLYEGIFRTELDDDEAVRLWSGVGTLVWNGVPWVGRGQLLGISPLEEATDMRAVGFTISLSGQTTSAIALALETVQDSQGKFGKCWLALFNQGGQLLAQPLLLKRGLLDIATATDSGDQCVISVQYEDRLVDLKRARMRQYTSEDQKIDFPDDLGFDFVPTLQDADINWS